MWVKASPEEKVRQKLLTAMVQELGYPITSLAVEKGLAQLPHLSFGGEKVPERRADILCFAKDIHPAHALYPLLLIECKAVKLTQKAFQQAVGYNYYLQAYFIALANESEIHIGWHDPKEGKYQFSKGLPSYPQLLSSLQLPRCS